MNRVLVPLALNTASFARARPDRVESLGGRTMGTSWSARLVLPVEVPLDMARQHVQSALDQVVAEMSHWEAASLLSRFNNAVPGEWRDLPPGFFHVLAAALDIARLTDGAYDPTIGPLVDLWGFGPVAARIAPPPADAIAEVRECVGWNRLTLDRDARRVRQPGGCRLDLSAIAKGHGVDRASAALRGLGIGDFLVEVGGELRGEGLKPDGSPWWVTLERPPAATGAGETLIALHQLSVATSGDYRRYFESGGRRYSHSIDPRTGVPVTNGVVSASVIHNSCMMADVLSTAITILGAEAGMALARAQNLAALVITADESGGVREHLSPALEAMLD